MKVGDILLVLNGDRLPADCVVLQVNDRKGECYVNTAELDGNCRLKAKLASKVTQDELDDMASELKREDISV